MNWVLVFGALTMYDRICGGILISELALQKSDSKEKIDKKKFIFAAVFSVIAAVLISFAITNWGGDAIFIMTIAEGICILRCNHKSLANDRRMAIFICVFYEMSHLLIANLAIAYTAIFLNDIRYLNPFEIEAYTHMYDPHYLEQFDEKGADGWRNFTSMSLSARMRYMRKYSYGI